MLAQVMLIAMIGAPFSFSSVLPDIYGHASNAPGFPTRGAALAPRRGLHGPWLPPRRVGPGPPDGPRRDSHGAYLSGFFIMGPYEKITGHMGASWS